MTTKFRRIGSGHCGSVWAPSTESGHARVWKREDGEPGRSLKNEHIMHRTVLKSLSASQSSVRVPGCHQYIEGSDWTWWEQILRFPPEFRKPCNILITDRIPPFSKRVRDIITKLYCPESVRPTIKLSEQDQDCLIRPYLGQRRRLEEQSGYFQLFTLRNLPLSVDQIEALEFDLDSFIYARMMAETLAKLYWGAHIDADDVEFVLAPARDSLTNQSGGHSANPTVIPSLILGDHNMWLLDFDCCKQMAMDETGVEQAVSAFYRNHHPYYPRPGRDNSKDQTLWKEFKKCFYKASEAILGRGSPEARLPALWVFLVEHNCPLEESAGAYHPERPLRKSCEI